MVARRGVVGVMVVAGLLAPAMGDAHVVYLVNGSRLVVDGWWETDETLEFSVGGGTVSVAKAEVTKIEEALPSADPTVRADALPDPGWNTTPSLVRMPLEAGDAFRRMLALLTQGQALFTDAVLTPAQKLRAARWLDDRWREFDVPDGLRPVYGRGSRAIRLAAEAFLVQAERGADAGPRLAEGALAVREAQVELQAGRARARQEEVP